MEFSAKQIAALLGGTIEGNEDAKVHTFTKIEEGVEGGLSFLANPKYLPYIYNTASTIILVSHDLVLEQPVKSTLIRVENPYEALAKLMSMYQQAQPKQTGISPQASIHPTATIGENVYIGAFACIEEGAVIGAGTHIHPHVTVGSHVKIGEQCTLYPQVTVYKDCHIGNRCILHAGAVIGADGFGFAPTAHGYEKIPQIGIVQIADDVEIGANTCIDRATMGTTKIEQGVKLDNLIQVAHNVQIGAHTVMASQVGIAGSAQIGEWCMFGGQVGVAGHITVGNKVNAGAQTGIHNSVKENAVMMGTPANESRQMLRIWAVQKNLPTLQNEVAQLKKELEELRKQLKP